MGPSPLRGEIVGGRVSKSLNPLKFVLGQGLKPSPPSLVGKLRSHQSGFRGRSILAHLVPYLSLAVGQLQNEPAVIPKGTRCKQVPVLVLVSIHVSTLEPMLVLSM